jgi:iron(III) transport system permease protein
MLAFSPIAFMILHGALTAVSPALEEAADAARVARSRVSLGHVAAAPGARQCIPAGFVESLADFGNPIVLSAISRSCRSSFFARSRRATRSRTRRGPGVSVFGFTLAAFWLQQLARPRIM